MIEQPLDQEHRSPDRSISQRMADRLQINVPGGRGNSKLRKVINAVNADEELYALWTAANVNAVERLGITDHGPVHLKIVMNIADKLLRSLVERGVEPAVVTNYDLTLDDAEVVVAVAALLHDIGLSILRPGHETYSLLIAERKAAELLASAYDLATATILRSEILHAIIVHRTEGKPMTLEAGIVRVADALDMTKNRSRIPVSGGSMSIHSISAAAIQAVHIEAGDSKAVRVRIELSNAAGILQLDQLSQEKLAGSGLEPYLELEADFTDNEENQFVKHFRL